MIFRSIISNKPTWVKNVVTKYQNDKPELLDPVNNII